MIAFWNNFTGVILSGGKSSRMGKDKGAILYYGKPLICHGIDALLNVFPRVLIIQDKPGHYETVLKEFNILKTYGKKLQFICDDLPYQGPIVGLKMACQVLYPNPMFVIACDMPWVKFELISFLCSQFRNQKMAVVPLVAGIFQPLCSSYNSALVRDLLLNEVFHSPFDFIKKYEQNMEILREETLRKFDPQLKTFANFNHPEDLIPSQSL